MAGTEVLVHPKMCTVKTRTLSTVQMSTATLVTYTFCNGGLTLWRVASETKYCATVLSCLLQLLIFTRSPGPSHDPII